MNQSLPTAERNHMPSVIEPLVRRRAARSQPDQEPWDRRRLPCIGMLATLVGAAIAVALVPSDPTPAGALIASGLALTAGMLIAPFIAVRAASANLLRAEVVAATGLIYWALLDLIQGSYPLPDVRQVDARIALALIGLFSASVWLGCLGKTWRLPRQLGRASVFPLPTSVVFTLGVSTFLLGMLAFAIPCQFDLGLMFRSLGAGRWSAPWVAAREGGWSSIIHHLAYFGYLVPAIAVMLARRVGWARVEVGTLLVMSIVFLAFIAQGGGRRVIGVVSLSAVAYWLLTRRPLKFRHFSIAAVLVALLLVVLQAILFVRNQGLRELRGETLTQAARSITGEEVEGGVGYLHVDDNFYRLCQIVRMVPEQHPYVYHKYLWYVAVRPIPRAIWKGKPLDGGFDLSKQINAQASLSSTIVGELYVSMGWVAVALGGWFVGRLASWPAALLRANRDTLAPMIYGYLTMILLVGTRSMVEIVLFSYALLGLLVVLRFLPSPIPESSHIPRRVASLPSTASGLDRD